MSLREMIPPLSIPHVPERYPMASAQTAPYAPFSAPPPHHTPYWILHSPTLTDWMMARLENYLATSPGGDMTPSPRLQSHIDSLSYNMLDTPSGRRLSNEDSTADLWNYAIFPVIRSAVQEVDQNPTLPQKETPGSLYSQTPDVVICPTFGTAPRLHQENKSWGVFDRFAPEILTLAQNIDEGQLGTPLELGINETGARSIIMKIGISMIGRANLIPYGLLFGGDRFMLFSLFQNANTYEKGVRHGLICSDIIDCTNATAPLIPLITYTLLGNINRPVQLRHPTIEIPPVRTPATESLRPVTRSTFRAFISTIPTKVTLRHTPSGGRSRTFLLYHESDASDRLATPLPPTTYSYDQAVEDPFATNASLVPFDIEISLTECIGHGVSGQVFIGTTGDEKFVIKVSPWKNQHHMMQQEANIYKVLSDLQGRCIPKVYGFYGSAHLKALIMTYMGHSVGEISDLSIDQCQNLFEDLCLIHDRGVMHGDLQAANIVLQDGTARLIDFSHGYQHECTGREACYELVEARRFLSLNIKTPLQTGQ